MTRRPAVTIIVPVYNEVTWLPELLGRLASLRVNREIVFVDDGSTDGSTARLMKARGRRIRVIRFSRNRGKGAAVRAGLARARGRITVVLDADLETSPADLPRLIRPLAGAGGRRAVFGVRFTRRGRGRGASAVSARLANRVITGAANLLFRSAYTDVACAYRAAPTALWRRLRLTSRRFELEAEVAAKIARLGVPVIEVPVRYRPRSYAQGKKIHPLDGLRILAALVRLRAASFREPAHRLQ